MRSAIEAVIFDFDGLIVENEHIQLQSFNETLATYGVSLTEEDFHALVGKTQKEIFGELREKFGIRESIENLTTRKREKYLRLVQEKLRPRSGLKELIKWVNARGLQKGIASSSPKEDVIAVLRAIGLDSEFDSVMSSFELRNGKPDPDIFMAVAKDLGVRENRCIVLEDSAIGVQAAKKAGMKCIAAPSFFTKEQNFSEADCVVSDLFEAKEQLDRWYGKENQNRCGGHYR